MKTSLENTQEKQQETIQLVEQEFSKGGEATIVDNRPAIAVQWKLRSAMDGTDNRNNPIQRKVYPEPSRRNNTGLPDNLKSGIENLSGYSMDDVKVHYKSSKPAQLQAHAYAQGTDIHLAPGQEKHLPHEAWHVVQQKQGRVKPTMQFKGKVNINDDAGLEKEADVMGTKANSMGMVPRNTKNINMLQNTRSLNNTFQLYRNAGTYKRLSVESNIYGADGHKVGTLPNKTAITISDKTIKRTLTLDSGRRKKLSCYVITSNPPLENLTAGGDTSVLYISWWNIRNKTKQLADPLDNQEDISVEEPLGEAEQALACWNWAIYALDDVTTVKELDKVFLLLERQVGFDRGGSQFLPMLSEQQTINSLVIDFQYLCNNRVANNDIDQEEADQMVEDYKNRIEQVKDAVAEIRDKINNEDLSNMKREDITRKYNYELTEVLLRDAGYQVLPPETTGTWKVCMHVKPGTYGWEHWWLRTPKGNYVDHFPVDVGIRKAKTMPFQSGDDDIIEVPVADIKRSHKQKADI